jgi:hypothetical protein
VCQTTGNVSGMKIVRENKHRPNYNCTNAILVTPSAVRLHHMLSQVLRIRCARHFTCILKPHTLTDRGATGPTIRAHAPRHESVPHGMA